MTPDANLLERAQRLVSDGHALIATTIENEATGTEYVDDQRNAKWRTQVRALLISVVGEDSSYTKALDQVDVHPSPYDVREALGCLIAFTEDLEAGHLRKYRDLVVAEVFSDFLEMAEHLLANHYFHPAASLIGAVLEDDLRRRCDVQRITYDRRRDGLDALSQKLVTAGCMSALTKKRVAVWGRIRNDADHGNFDEFTEPDVVDMLKGVTDFCAS